jgi:hypothetical protein
MIPHPMQRRIRKHHIKPLGHLDLLRTHLPKLKIPRRCKPLPRELNHLG